MQAQRRGLSVVQGEASLLLSAMRRGGRWNGHARTVRDPVRDYSNISTPPHGKIRGSHAWNVHELSQWVVAEK